jgi:hypothetical protein
VLGLPLGLLKGKLLELPGKPESKPEVDMITRHRVVGLLGKKNVSCPLTSKKIADLPYSFLGATGINVFP